MSAVKLGIVVVLSLLTFGCADKETGPQLATVEGKILSEIDSTPIVGANIVLYDATSNSPVTRALSKVAGEYRLSTTSTVSFLRVVAQDWISSPPKGGAPLFFETSTNVVVRRDFYLRKDSLSVGTGSLSGTVKGADGQGVAGLLVTASRTTDSTGYSTVSGPGGFYVIYNVEPGTYLLQCRGAGYNQVNEPVTAALDSSATLLDRNLSVLTTATGVLSGQVTFLATKNSNVDVTLVHPVSRDAIPGLSVMSTDEKRYSISSIPFGTYIAWATYMNDGCVMDPDWLFKNGLPLVTLSEGSATVQLPFSVTDAIIIESPSNAPDSIYPVEVGSASPAFKWKAYPSAKEYIVEVLNSRGDVIWGGFGRTGTVGHQQIPASQVSAFFNFDQSASEPIRAGETYRWIVYADNDNAIGVQQLISSSEEQRGLFYLPLP